MGIGAIVIVFKLPDRYIEFHKNRLRVASFAGNADTP